MANKTMHHTVIGPDTFELVDQSARADVSDLKNALDYYYKMKEDELDLDLVRGYYTVDGANFSINSNNRVGCISNYVEINAVGVLKIADTTFKYIPRVFNFSTQTWDAVTPQTGDYDLSRMSSFAHEGKLRLLFEVAKRDDSNFDATEIKLNNVVSFESIIYLDGEYIEDRTIGKEKLEADVLPNLDGTATRIESSYTKKYNHTFEAGVPVKIKLAENSSSTPNVAFHGFVNVEDQSGEWQFSLSVGKAYIWTPQKDYAALQWATNGSCVVEIYNQDGLLSNVPLIFYCGKNRELTTLKAGLEKAEEYFDSVLYVDDGEYDLIDEFGSAYFENIGANDTMKGLQLRNRVHVIFSSNSKVVCNYNGSNVNVMKIFSPFNTFDYGFTLENLTLECSNVRYAIHDERTGGIEECRSIYKNCNIKIDNSANTEWLGASCIGGGLGSNHQVEIENCVFNAIPYAGSRAHGIYYHQSNNNNNPNHCCRLIFYNNYIINGDIYFDFVRTDATENTVVMATNNNLKQYANQDANGISPATRTGTHTTYYVWNNTLRNE